ncbi:MAG: HYR domain-containing protein, partial [Clostridia bacterium]|nr:HYR domain-containing protein [Clostridia bacterium]
HLCTAVFVARDEYGGVTILAPQIGDQRRVEVSGGIYGWEVYGIDYYGSYYDDPYSIDDNFLTWRRIYNQPSYFGKQLLGFESYIEKNSETGGEKYREITNGAASLEYNLFNIVTNDISWGFPEESSRYYEFGDYYYRPYSYITYADGDNYELIYWDGATITFTGGDLGDEEVTLDLRSGDVMTALDDGAWTNTPNTIGYMGASVYTGSDGIMRFAFDVAYPRANASHPAGTQVKRQYVIRCHNKYGDSYEISGTVTLYYIDYTLEVHMEDHGAELELSFLSKESGETYRTGRFNSGVYTVALTDLYGNKVELSYAVADGLDARVEIALSEFEKTPGPVTVTLHSPEGLSIRADITDYAIMSVEGNDSDSVTVTLRDSMSFSYRYIDPDSGDEVMKIVSIENIKKPDPKIVWSYDEGTVLEDENGNRYKYGEVTAYLVDENYVLVDQLTGKAPSFTFVPNSSDGYTFIGSQIKAVMGAYEVELEQNYTAMLSIQLRELPDPLGFNVEDKETPNVQILAYAEQNGYYLNANLALRLEAVRGMSNLPTYANYTTWEFSGDRLNVQKALDALGWGTSFRFEIQTDDGSRVKLFIKEGIYAEAPDYNTGYSDTIPGVELNSKLLTVRGNAAFSLFVVDAHNNAVSIAFDVNNVGEAPVPKVIKVDRGNGVIRGYLFPPDGASNFAIVGTTGVKIDSDSSVDSEYFGKYYVEYEKNDDYVINYRFDYNGKNITGEIRVAVTEIMLDEIALIDVNQPIWSANKAFEATPFAVTATATMTKEIKDIRINGAYDKEKVNFVITNNVLTVTFLDNHPAVEILCLDAADNHVTVRFDGVENIDKNAPVIEEVSRVLAANGRSLLVTFSSNERALFKEGGYVGEQATDEHGNTVYYYTRTILQNGEYSYSFVDMSGLITQIDITVSEIVSEPLEALYSTSFDGKSPTTDPSALDVMIGDKIFVKANRDALLEMTGGVAIELAAGVWSEMIVPDALGGLHPYVIISDQYGNVLTHQFSSIKVPDTTPPEIVVSKKIYSVRIGTTREEIEAALLANFTAFDDLGGEVTLSVRFTENIDAIGVTEVEYIATDSEGNSATVKEKLRITSIYEPVVRYGEIKLDRGDGVIVSAEEELIMNVDCNGMPYMVRIKAGNRTEAQMKDGSTVVTDYTTDGTVSFGKLEKGIYTICIVTQERDYFKIIISVE